MRVFKWVSEGVSREYRVEKIGPGDLQVETREHGRRGWVPISRQALLQFAVNSPMWDWLRENGIIRPSPSGHVTEQAREGVQVKLRVDAQTSHELETLAEYWGQTKSKTFEILVKRALKEAEEARNRVVREGEEKEQEAFRIAGASPRASPGTEHRGSPMTATERERQKRR